MISFGERLKFLREQKKLTPRQVSEIFQITERAYRYYEANKSTPHFKLLLIIAEYFDVSLDYLVGWSDEPKINK